MVNNREIYFKPGSAAELVDPARQRVPKVPKNMGFDSDVWITGYIFFANYPLVI